MGKDCGKLEHCLIYCIRLTCNYKSLELFRKVPKREFEEILKGIEGQLEIKILSVLTEPDKLLVKVKAPPNLAPLRILEASKKATEKEVFQR